MTPWPWNMTQGHREKSSQDRKWKTSQQLLRRRPSGTDRIMAWIADCKWVTVNSSLFIPFISCLGRHCSVLRSSLSLTSHKFLALILSSGVSLTLSITAQLPPTICNFLPDLIEIKETGVSLGRRRLQPAVSPADGHLATPTVAGLPGLCEISPNCLHQKLAQFDNWPRLPAEFTLG